MKRVAHILGLVAFAASLCGYGQSGVEDLTLEELMAVEITTLSKKQQTLSTVPAAVHVITADDIRRSPATTLPELLETVPGLFSAPVSGGVSGVSARGAISRFANKLLVMIDGRTVYTPLFSGVFWEAQGVNLADVERIEIIRGPGGTLWGANAVNGIINVITKPAGATIGGYAQTDAGNQDLGLAARYGWRVDEALAVRLYGQATEKEPGYAAGGAHDDWRSQRGGVRLDWEPSESDTVTLIAEASEVRLGQEIFVPDLTAPAYGQSQVDETKIHGGFILGRWHHEVSDTSDYELQGYWDHTRHKGIDYDYRRHTFELDFQHRLQCWDRHEVVWGLGYRGVVDELGDAQVARSSEGEESYRLLSAFAQDEIHLTDRLSLTLGSKLEYNDYTNLEWQPSARLAWMPTKRQTVWAGYSRAVRTPSRAENDIVINLAGSGSGWVRLIGNGDFDSEIVDAYEVGLRSVFREDLTLDLTLFYNEYGNLRTIETVDPLTQTFGNEMSGESYGGEAVLSWRLDDWLNLYGAYSYARLENHLASGSTNTGGSENEEREYPQHQAYLGVGMDFGDRWEADLIGRYVDNVDQENLPATFEMNARLAWRPTAACEVAILGRNLLDNRRQAIGNQGTLRVNVTEVRRSLLVRLTCRF